ncbi:hypothetical protein FA10DRAFT_96770 [Acaromyces ingoldii]|uniref:Zn(2)-C6 fungal-type domain-containing protein n=1 Tax=Acaromyces ingoldii TaxID=215250 RepID=A0A316YKM1_9BASI|nr:hypothetical protein FA10DRAFT_96770 [Acaromyces ingoldii]PWN89759.1 hypothetical protein FA10DRAFT_96770 [Acaromyces ingoldii]
MRREGFRGPYDIEAPLPVDVSLYLRMMPRPTGSNREQSAFHAGGGTTSSAHQRPLPMNLTTGHRYRHQKSCAPCRSRKTKCDRTAPCASCVMRSTEHLCYSDVAMAPIPLPVSSNHDPNAGFMAPEHARSVPLFPPSTTNSTHLSTSEADFSSTPNRTSGNLHSRNRSTSTSFAQLGAAGPLLLPELVTWQGELQFLLPDPLGCEKLFHCFSSELDGIFACVHPLHLDDVWQRLQEGASVPRSAGALLLAVSAVAMLLAPKAHAAHRVKTASGKGHEEVFSAALDNLQQQGACDSNERHTPQTIFESLQGLDLCCHYANMAGNPASAWFLISYAARLGKVIDLFDEHSWDKDLSELEREMRRRVAWDLIALDRWQAIFRRQRADLDIVLDVKKPDLYPWGNYDWTSGRLLGAGQMPASDSLFEASRRDPPTTTMTTNMFLEARNSMSDLILEAHLFLRRLPSLDWTQRRATAMALEAAFDTFEQGLPPELDYGRARLETTTSSTLQSTECLRRLGLSLTTWSCI